MKLLSRALPCLALLLFSLPGLSQGGVVLTPGGGGTGTTSTGTGGCVNSPENPTAILALVGAAGGGFPYLRARYRARRKR